MISKIEARLLQGIELGNSNFVRATRGHDTNYCANTKSNCQNSTDDSSLYTNILGFELLKGNLATNFSMVQPNTNEKVIVSVL